MSMPAGYVTATRHPWAGLLFVLPLLVVYEVGVLTLGGPNPETVRNGADHWLRTALRVTGNKLFWVPPLLLVIVFIVWTYYRWKDRPGDLVNVLSGMMLESVCFALGLWMLSRMLAPLLLQAGIDLTIVAPTAPVSPPPPLTPTLPSTEPVLRQVVTYLGAGIYEEALFRLALFTALVALLRLAEMSGPLAVGMAAVASAILFAVAHHLGPYGQVYSNYLFLFRVMAGLYFALLYETRGFGIAVGTHACYNVMVSLT